MEITKDLIRNIVHTRFEDLDAQTVERAKIRIFDAVGCIIAGANAVQSRKVLELVTRWGGAGESTIIVHGGKTPSHNAAMINSIMCRAYDFEPVQAEGIGGTLPAHISGTTVPVALCMGEQQAASGRDFITALVLGDDLASRLTNATGFDFDLGWDNTGTVNQFGAAAVAGKLLKLDEDQIQNAFGIVIHQLGGTMDHVNDKVMAFALPIALSARNGIFSAELAKLGYTGVKDAIFGKNGYFALFTKHCYKEQLTEGLGKKFYGDCVIKPYSACRMTHPPIDCAIDVAASNDLNAADIGKVIVNLPKSYLNSFTGQPFIPSDTPQIDCAFSIRFTVANALLRRRVRPEDLTKESINSPEIQSLLGKMDLTDADQAEHPGIGIQVELKDGRVYSARAPKYSRGEIFNNPLTKEEIREKFRENAAFSKTISYTNAEKALQMIEHLEDVEDVSSLIKLLV